MKGRLTGPDSAKTALSNAWSAVHRGDADGAKMWIEQAEERIDDHLGGVSP